MPYKKVNPLSETNTLDLQVLNDLANNDAYFDSIIPDVYIRDNATGVVNQSLLGAQAKIQGGSFAVPAFSGPRIFNIPFPLAHNGKYYAPVVATFVSSAVVTTNITSVNMKGFNVRITPAAKGSISGARINWIALTQVG